MSVGFGSVAQRAHSTRHVLGDYQGKCMDDHAVVIGGTVPMRNRERISMALQSIRTIPGMLGPSLVGWSRWVSAH